MYRKISAFMRILPVLLLFAGVSVCKGQFSASVQGTVTDPSGAVIVKATVTLHNSETGVDATSSTNNSGFYRFSSVAPGNYSVITKLTGFAPSSVSVTVTTAETRGVNITLTPTAGTTTLTVTSVASALNPDETRVQTTIPAEEIGKLPLPNRDVQMLIALTPGVVGYQNESPNSGYGSSIFAANFDPAYHSNGLSSASNLYLIDDLPVMSSMNEGNAQMLPNAEMIQEVSLQAQTYSVENGTSASLQTAFTTKSGSNRFHGTMDYSYDGNNVGAATDPISRKVAPFHQDLLLASLGGPIRKDRTFFFGSVEKQNAGIGAVSAVNPYLTPQFAQWALSAFPNSGAAQGLVFAPPTRDEGGAVIYANDSSFTGPYLHCGTTQTVTDPSGNAYSYNLPCNTPVYVKGAFLNQAQPFDGTQWNVRLDQNFREGKDRLYGMYERIDQTLGDLAERPALDAQTPSQNKYFSINYVHLFSPKLLNEAHFGNLRSVFGLHLGDPRAASIPWLPILSDNAAHLFTFPFGITPFASQIDKTHTYAFRDTVTYTLHNHTISAGYQYYRGDAFQDSSGIYARPFVPFFATDTISFVSNTHPAGYSLYTIGANGRFTPQYYGASSRYNGVFVDDNWRMNDRLTLDAGLRYDNFGNPLPYGNTAQPFVPMFPGSGSTFQQQAWHTSTHIASQAFTQAQDVNFMPRAGFAYTPFDDRLTLIRGGIGLYENVMTPFQIAGNLPTQPPNRISLYATSLVPYGDFKTTSEPYGYTYSYPTYGTDPYGNIYSNPTQTAVYGANLNGFVPGLKPEKALEYSLGIERQLPANIVAGVSYVGSHGYDLVYGSAGVNSGGNADYNLQTAAPGKPFVRPTSEWGQINYGRNGLSSNFNELVLTLKQSYKRLNYQANYNWSRSLQYAPTTYDTAGGNTYSLWNSVNDPKSYYGLSQFDVPQSFSLAGAYEVPQLFTGKLAREAASGWRVSTIVIAQSGSPFTVVNNQKDYAYDGSIKFDGTSSGTPGMPDYLGTQRSGFSRSLARKGVLTASQFADPAGYGTMAVQSTQGANTFRNYGYFNVDAGLAKTFQFRLPWRESGSLVLRGEAVNLLNRTNYQSIQNDMSNSSTFGTVLAANQKRYVQIGGRFEF